MTAEQLIKRFSKLEAGKAAWNEKWEEVAGYVRPNKADFVTRRSAGDPATSKLFDSTAIHASNLLAASIHGALTSPATLWFRLAFREDDLNEIDAANEWLEDCAVRMKSAIDESRFNSQVNELYHDLIDFGTGNILVELEDNRLRLRTFHLSKIAIAEDKDGVVDTLFIEFPYTARQAAQAWPDAEMPRIRKALEKDPDQEFPILLAIFPREGAAEGEVVAKKRPWAGVYISKSDKEVLEETGYYEMPGMVPRWDKRAGDVYGYGPAIVALPDIKTLNEAKRYELSAWEKAIDPPLKGDANSIVGDVLLGPGKVTWMRDMNALQPLHEMTNWTASQIKSEELRQSIRNIFHTDELMLPERANATATEVQIRYETMQRLLGPTLGRLQSEFLNPFIERVFNLMYRAGLFEDPPEELAEMNGNIDIEYVGPLARSQRMDEVTSIERWLGMLANVAQMFPEVTDHVDTDGLPEVLAERLGVPADAKLSRDEVERKREKAAEAADQAQAQMQQQMAMEAMNGQPQPTGTPGQAGTQALGRAAPVAVS